MFADDPAHHVLLPATSMTHDLLAGDPAHHVLLPAAIVMHDQLAGVRCGQRWLPRRSKEKAPVAQLWRLRCRGWW